ncbi:MAG: 3-isopropylmalate dehydratase [bacterium]|nr:3-isopropylmalate dehydratase [bacterium]
MSTKIRGRAYVVGDSIDTDQIIPAEHLGLVPTIPGERRQLGSFALSGLPTAAYPSRLVEPGQSSSAHTIVIAGKNFGCGSSREHAPIALGAAGVRAVVAESFARIFFRNCMATGEVYPLESQVRLCTWINTGDEIEIDLEAEQIMRCATEVCCRLRPPGEVVQVVGAGGLFAYARDADLIPARSYFQ